MRPRMSREDAFAWVVDAARRANVKTKRSVWARLARSDKDDDDDDDLPGPNAGATLWPAAVPRKEAVAFG